MLLSALTLSPFKTSSMCGNPVPAKSRPRATLGMKPNPMTETDVFTEFGHLSEPEVRSRTRDYPDPNCLPDPEATAEPEVSHGSRLLSCKPAVGVDSRAQSLPEPELYPSPTSIAKPTLEPILSPTTEPDTDFCLLSFLSHRIAHLLCSCILHSLYNPQALYSDRHSHLVYRGYPVLMVGAPEEIRNNLRPHEVGDATPVTFNFGDLVLQDIAEDENGGSWFVNEFTPDSRNDQMQALVLSERQ
jgi:hypothetical protein